MKPVVVERSAEVTTIGSGGGEWCGERKERKEKRKDSGYEFHIKNSFWQQDDSALQHCACTCLRGIRSAWLPRVLTYPARP